MREIKFRAWIPLHEKSEMMAVEEIEWNPDGSIKEINAGYCYSDKYNPEMLDRVILMQFTGLKDKNGKEIYEGDVMTQDKRRVEKPNNRVVKYQIEQGAFFVVGNSLEKMDWDDCLTKERIDFFGYEIIGDIYSNPELLK